MPVLIYERVKTAQYLRFFKRYKHKLVFAGKVPVLGILLIGLSGYWYFAGTRYGTLIRDALWGVLGIAKLDDGMFKVLEWFQKKGNLIVYVTREL